VALRLSKLIREVPAKAPSAPRSSLPAMSAAVPLVGRDGERERLRAWLGETHVPVALLSGDPGAGKTRIMDDVVEIATRRGAVALRGRAYAAESGRAFGPWRDALTDEETNGPLFSSLADDGHERATRSRLFDELLAALDARRGEAPQLVVALDDLQWLDEASAAFLHFVARRADDHRVLLVCAVRPAELLDNPSVGRVVDALRSDGQLFDVELGPLDAAAVSRICEAVAAGIDTARVMERSEGNPFFATELAHALARGEADLPENARRVVETRLRALSESARELLPWAAALGRTFHIDVLERVTRLDPVELIDRVGELERRGVFEPRGRDSYDFAHDLVRDAAYRELSGPRCRMVHRSIVRSLFDWPQRPADVGTTELLRHAELGEERATACRAAVDATREALGMCAWVDACSIADRGIQHVSALAVDDQLPTLLELLRCRVQAASTLQRPHPPHVTKALENAIALGGSTRQKFESLYLQNVVHGDRGEGARAEQATVAAVDVSRDAEPETAARLIAHSARCLVHVEREVGRARTLHAEAREALEALDLSDVEHHWSAGLLAQWDGQLDAAIEHIEAALALARHNGDRWREASCTTSLMKACLEAQQWDRVQRLAERPFTFETPGARAPRSPFVDALAALARMQSDGRTRPELEAALSELRERDANVQRGYVLAELARWHLDGGRLDEARGAAEEAAAAAESVSRTVVLGDALATAAQVSLRQGDEAAARRALARALELAEGSEAMCMRVRAALSDVAARLDG
jgi:tetratricopeptide (TPR) repeat protein